MHRANERRSLAALAYRAKSDGFFTSRGKGFHPEKLTSANEYIWRLQQPFSLPLGSRWTLWRSLSRVGSQREGSDGPRRLRWLSSLECFRPACPLSAMLLEMHSGGG